MKKIKKQKSKTKQVSRKPRAKKFAAHYLGIILVSVLLLEGILFSASTAADWNYAFEIFDMSEAVVEVSQDLSEVLAPQVSVYHGVTNFYMAAADEITPMLDLSESVESVATVWFGVSEFYNQASIELAILLDFSDQWNQAKISGASIVAH